MKLDNLEDLLKVDTDSGKAQENKNLLKEIKQILKKQTKAEINLDKKAEEMPYEAVSVVGNRFVTVKFNLDTREAVVSDIRVDSRDTGVQNHMALYSATSKLREISIKTTGDNGKGGSNEQN